MEAPHHYLNKTGGQNINIKESSDYIADSKTIKQAWQRHSSLMSLLLLYFPKISLHPQLNVSSATKNLRYYVSLLIYPCLRHTQINACYKIDLMRFSNN